MCEVAMVLQELRTHEVSINKACSLIQVTVFIVQGENVRRLLRTES
jgi:hypothetical protein